MPVDNGVRVPISVTSGVFVIQAVVQGVSVTNEEGVVVNPGVLLAVTEGTGEGITDVVTAGVSEKSTEGVKL